MGKEKERVTVYVLRPEDRANLMLQWIDPKTGKRKSVSAGTADPDEAETARGDKEYELNNGLHKEPSKTTWQEFRESFEEEYLADARANTVKNYIQVLDLYEGIIGTKKMRDIDTRAVSRFAAGLRRRKGNRGRDTAAPATVRQRLALLQTALGWARRQGMLTELPEFPEVTVPKKKPRPVPPEQFEKLLGQAGDDRQMKAYLLCGWLAGLRLNEAFMLSWEPTEEAPYLDLGARRIVLPAEFVKAVEDQWVPLDPALQAALLALPRREGDARVFRFTDPRGGEYHGREVQVGAVLMRVCKMGRRAGVPLTMHSLRRGFGCRYAGKVSAQVLQRLMRHSNISVTMDYYANVDVAVEEAVFGRGGGEPGPQPNTPPNTGQDGGGNAPAVGYTTRTEESTSGDS